MSIQSIVPADVALRLAAKGPFVFLDVRTPIEFRAMHAAGAKSLPLSRLDEVCLSERAAKNQAVLFICHSGVRASKACELASAWGFCEVYNVEGGTVAWQAAGLPVERTSKVLSLERQVRIATGTLVVAGCLLALAVDVGFITLAIVVGCGLVFAGLTDSCAMGYFLAKMPWNRDCGCGTASQAAGGEGRAGGEKDAISGG